MIESFPIKLVDSHRKYRHTCHGLCQIPGGKLKPSILHRYLPYHKYVDGDGKRYCQCAQYGFTGCQKLCYAMFEFTYDK